MEAEEGSSSDRERESASGGPGGESKGDCEGVSETTTSTSDVQEFLSRLQAPWHSDLTRKWKVCQNASRTVRKKPFCSTDPKV